MTDDNKTPPTAFERFSPWFGALMFVAFSFYALERNQDIPWYMFGISGALMGLAKAMAHFKGLK